MIFVAEIEKKPVAIFNAECIGHAEAIVKDSTIVRDDLVMSGLCSDEIPIFVRHASADEIAQWEKRYGGLRAFEFLCDSDSTLLGVLFLHEAENEPDMTCSSTCPRP